ncbi:MAG: hypothetical protein U0573_04550 [Phycisphaerales bacterium]
MLLSVRQKSRAAETRYLGLVAGDTRRIDFVVPHAVRGQQPYPPP